ncbi:MAG: MFS transporter [Gammaproteobacteria bacterium]
MKTAAIDSGYAWLRLAACLALTTVGSAGMFVVVVAMPEFQTDFGLSRGGAAVPYTMVMAGFGLGGIVVGRIVDKYGVIWPLALAAVALALSYLQAGLSQSVLLFNLAHIQIGCFGCATVFAPLIADISKWFTRRRGLAVAICASGNYVSGAVWPPLMYEMLVADGWRETYMAIGVISVAVMLPLLLLLRRRPIGDNLILGGGGSAGSPAMLGLTPNALLGLLCIAGVGCCMAMAMPQVHLVSLCGDRGYGAARGAEMLAVMLGCGIVSRLGFGFVSDRLGGLRTILIGSILQTVALALFLPADTLASLYVVSALFGLFQGGIVPCYALIVREYFPESEAGGRLGIIILATLVGMALGGWTSGVIFDWTGSYMVAFIHGIGWNLVNLSVIVFLLARARGAVSGAYGSAASRLA